MISEEIGADALWGYYQRGYHCIMQSGLYFRQILRPALSHIFFRRAMPLLVEYARANRNDSDLPPGFGERMQACTLTPRDLLHLDYAICLGYAEYVSQSLDAPSTAPVMDWPGIGVDNGVFIPTDALLTTELETLFPDLDETESGSESDDDEQKPPFDL